MEQKKPSIKKEIWRRVRVLYLVFVVIGFTIVGRVEQIQWGEEGDSLRNLANKRNFDIETVDAARGDIITENGELLATSVNKYYVDMDLRATGLKKERFDESIEGLATGLARIMGDRTAAEYRRLLQNGWDNRAVRRHVRLTSRLVSYTELQQICTLPLMSLSPNQGGRVVTTLSRRVRPYGRLAERTIGKTREVLDSVEMPTADTAVQNKIAVLTPRGQSGIEFSYDSHLRGRSGQRLTQKITSSFSIPVMDSPLNVEPVDGHDVVTTLDMDFQDVASTMLARQLVEHNAIWGTVVLMEVATGEIKAIANLTNHGGECIEDYNYAVGQFGLSEPGSTFKLASLLALLDDGMNLKDPVHVGSGVMQIPGGATIRDDHDPEASDVPLKRVFETSSNVGFVKAVTDRFTATGREQDYIDYMANLGFDRHIGMGMTGEARPKFHKPTPEERKSGAWHQNSLAYMSHGYGFEISPLHTLTLYNAVAGGGRMVRPLLVKEIREEGEPIQKFFTTVINPSIAPQRTIRAVREALEGVVDEGTATVLKNPYYKVAAKTGTAQAESYGGGVGQQYLATMVGYFPADNPVYSCIVCIRTRYGSTNRNIYGSSLAGPVFKAIADRVYVTRHDWQVPVNKGNARTDEVPPTKVSLASLALESGVMPEVVGMGLRDALYLLESRGLVVEFSGKGAVVSQLPPAGEAVEVGATANIILGQ
ncbi:MAG: transpeptidase family protein [Rikenellaceae bacterium]|jgi:cell division protein FtsI (penicillin-binding protein 3)|nr:transpeptidase family protein [Rikenellaceae bacterium]